MSGGRATAALALWLALAACGSPAVSQPPAPVGEATVTEPPVRGPVIVTETIVATGVSTAAEPPGQAPLHLGDLRLTPFAPPLFVGDLAKTVFVENGLLRIDSPQGPREPPDLYLVTGAVTDVVYDSFDVSATFNAEGGACRGIDHPCGNVFVTNCIVFDFVDLNNWTRFCIEASSLFWTLIAFENGAVVYHSSVQKTDAIHDTGVIYYREHPIPNEVRLTLRGGLLAGSINGQPAFERDGSRVNGKVGAGCVNWSLDPNDEFSNCETTLVVTR